MRLCLLSLLMFLSLGTGAVSAHYYRHSGYYDHGSRHHRYYSNNSYTVEDNTGDKVKYDRYGNYVPEEKKLNAKEGEKVICRKDKDGKIICDD